MEKETKQLKEDRRVRKTKKALSDALMALIIEKGYDAVTIQDIIDRADVGRTTFYTHYETKEQLLTGNISFQEELIKPAIDDPDGYPMGINLAYFFNDTKDYLELHTALLGTRCLEILRNYFTELFAGKIMEYYKRKFDATSERDMLIYRAHAASGAIVRMYFKWLEDKATHPAEKMINYAREILNALLPRDPCRPG